MLVGIVIEVFHHLDSAQRGILRRPRTGRVAQDAKFEWQPLPVGVDVRIDAARISLEAGAVLLGRNLNRFARRRSQAQDSLLAIVLEKAFPQNFREFARSEAAHGIHLPQPVLRRYVSLRKKEIVKSRRVDGRNAVRIPCYLDPRRESRNLHSAVQLGKGRARDEIEPRDCTQGSEHEDDQEESSYAPKPETFR